MKEADPPKGRSCFVRVGAASLLSPSSFDGGSNDRNASVDRVRGQRHLRRRRRGKDREAGHSGTPQANIWISLEPAWTVRVCDDGDSIEVEYKRQRMN